MKLYTVKMKCSFTCFHPHSSPFHAALVILHALHHVNTVFHCFQTHGFCVEVTAWTDPFWLQWWGLLVAHAKKAFICTCPCHLYMTCSMSWISQCAACFTHISCVVHVCTFCSGLKLSYILMTVMYMQLLHILHVHHKHRIVKQTLCLSFEMRHNNRCCF